jgi:hypothetical protein
MRYTLRPNSRSAQRRPVRERIVAAELKRLELRFAAQRRDRDHGVSPLD